MTKINKIVIGIIGTVIYGDFIFIQHYQFKNWLNLGKDNRPYKSNQNFPTMYVCTLGLYETFSVLYFYC